MKTKDIMDTTSDSRVYKLARKRYLETKAEISCSYCPYHRCENGWWYKYYDRSWKRNRKKQYKGT